MAYQKQNIRYLKGVGERREKLFLKLGVDSVGSLLRYYPRRYIDLGECVPVMDAPFGAPSVVKVTVFRKHPPLRIGGGRTLYKVDAGDESGGLSLTFFNNRYTPASLKEGEAYLFYGKIQGSPAARETVNPQPLKPDGVGGLQPQYPATEGLSSRVIASAVKTALVQFGEEIPETLPEDIRKQFLLTGLREALCDIHFPADETAAEAAKKRLIFEELFTMQLGMLLFHARAKSSAGAPLLHPDPSPFLASLPFSPTDAQLRCIGEIAEDLKKDVPMSRLLQGDVGSGKTVVAAAAVFSAAKEGVQSAVMAPTEILASQHAASFSQMLAPFGYRVGLLTGAVRGAARKRLLEEIKTGVIDVVVGTHAVIGDGVVFQNLGFVAADEQHRFGVEQRGRLSGKGINPHLLVMSATPIPRTLALMIYGDLSISVIDRLPPGRKAVKTFLVDERYRARYLHFAKQQADAGRQVYIVCPLVDESELVGQRAAAAQYKAMLEKHLAGYSVGLIHGKMKPAEKNGIMERFRSGGFSILVSTTVIEVGVDVPNATLMIIENAETFGLSALHQLRGRIGRGGDESTCVLVSAAKTESARQRLRIMTETNDGFKIARFDLQQRGPGDFFGRRQHGLPELRIADLLQDDRVLYDAANAAKALVKRDPSLSSCPLLREQAEEMFRDTEGRYN